MSKLVQKSNVAVIGAGISGLSFVYFLSKLRPDLQFTIYEESNRLGGYINTEKHRFKNESINLDKGPRTLRGASDGTTIIVDTLVKLGHKDLINVIPSNSIANKKYLLSPENELVQVPNDLNSTFKFLRSSIGKGLLPGLLTEIFKPQLIHKTDKLQDESVESFLTRRFGKSLPNNIISAVFNGIYAADIGKLSAKTTLKAMYDAESNSGSIVKSMLKNQFVAKKDVDTTTSILKKYESCFPNEDYKISVLQTLLKKFPMIVLRNGLEDLPRSIAEHLSKNNNVTIVKNDPIISINRNGTKSITLRTSSGITKDYAHVRSTVNATIFASMLQNGSLITLGTESSPTAAISSELKFINIFLINLYIRKNVIKHHGFGYLIPKSNQNNERVLGVIFDSDIEKSASPLFTTEISKALKAESPFPDIIPHYNDADYTKLTIMMGGHYWSKTGTPSMEKSLIAAKDALTNQLGINFEELVNEQDYYLDSILIPECLPQYHIGYDDLKKRFKDSLKKEFGERLSSGGMSFGDGAGVPDCVVNSFKNAEKLA